MNDRVPVTSEPHRVFLYLGKYGDIEHRIECPGGDDRECKTLTEASEPWPGPHECNCLDVECEACATGNHDECESDDWNTCNVLGAPGCRLELMDGCGVELYPDSPIFGEGEWPETFPILAASPRLRAWPSLRQSQT